MNANELIEELEDAGSFFEDALYLKSAALLRQQQDKLTKYELRHAEQRKRIDELEAELKLIDELVRGKK